jgi:UDP-N-acetylmuramate dehydrogenase
MTNKNSISMKEYSYFRTGGICHEVHCPSSIEELSTYLQSCDKSRSIQLLGLGSNSLVGDDEFDGSFIIFKDLSNLSLSKNTLIVGAGVENTTIAEFAYNQGLQGAEWMYRLPGQIGATTRMNARCYGGEISQIVSKVVTLDFKGQMLERSNRSMFRGYKDTIFMSLPEIIVEVHLALIPIHDKSILKKKMDFCSSDRVNKGQFIAPSCGCVFKNNYDVGIPSGMLLDAAGAKNLTRGGAKVSSNHANFIFNQGQASARDILELSFIMRESVYSEFGVWMDYEMELLGSFSEDLKQQYYLKKESKPNPTKLAALKESFNKSQKKL